MSSVRLGEYAGDESLDADEGDGGPCCFQGVEPGGDNVCGTTFLTTEFFPISRQMKKVESDHENNANRQKKKTKKEFLR